MLFTTGKGTKQMKLPFFHLIDSFTIESESITEPRKSGSKMPLKKKLNQINHIFGLKTSTKTGAHIQDMAMLYQNKDETQIGFCLLDSRWQINKEACNWCTHRKTCDTTEKTILKSIEFGIQTRDTTVEDTRRDGVVLKKWLQEKKNVIAKNGFVFSNKEDIFKPGFGNNNSRKMLLMPLAEITLDAWNKKNSWPHLFYSPFLARTLTLFEAMIIDYIPRNLDSPMVESKAIYFEEDIPIISGRVLRESLSKIGLTWPATKEECIDIIQNSALMDPINDLAHSMLTGADNEIFTHLLSKTSRYASSGLYGPEEVFEWNSRSEDFESDFKALIWEAWEAVNQDSNQERVDRDFIQERISAQIFLGEKMGELSVPKQHRILRISRVEGLIQNWILMDTETYQYPVKIQRREESKLPLEWLSNDTTAPTVLSNYLFEIQQSNQGRDGALHTELVHWTKPFGNQNGLNINYYSPIDLFAAYSMDNWRNQIRVSAQAPGSKKMFRNLEALLDTMFLRFRDWELEHDLHKKMSLLHREIRLPEHRRNHPNKMILTIAKDPAYHEFMRFSEDPDGTDLSRDISTEQIEFTTYQLDGEDSKISKNKIRIRSVSGGSEKKISSKPVWNVHTTPSSVYNNIRKGFTENRLIEIMNWQPDFKLRGSLKQRHLWISPLLLGFMKILTPATKDLAASIHDVIKHDGVHGVVLMALEKERHIIENIVGNIDCKVVNFDGQDGENNVIRWSPRQTISTTSPNFLNLGRQDD
jgi:hypothetical protein